MGKRKQRNLVAHFEYELEKTTETLDRNYGIQREFFRVDERLGYQNKNVEFKNGPGFLENNFQLNVAKHICGFINSRENGTLYLGVDEEGKVTGYYFNHFEEEKLRHSIETAILDVQPGISAADCSAQFVPVYSSGGTQRLRDLWVIIITVAGSKFANKDRLYEIKQGVFLQTEQGLDGPLSAQTIQEWTRRQYKVELDKLKKTIDNLKRELELSRSGYSDKERQLQQRAEDLIRRERELNGLNANQRNYQERFESLTDRFKQLEAENKRLQSENSVLRTTSEDIRRELREIKQIVSRPREEQNCCCIC